jgi:DNA-binding transcriptional LysR family regulator
MPVQLVVCAAPAYIERFGAPASIDDLTHHRCSCFRHPTSGKLMPWEFKLGEQIVGRDIAPALCTNDVDLEIRAVVAGQVIGQLIGSTAAPFLRNGQLVPLLTQHVTDHLGLYVYYGTRVAQPLRVRAFIDLAVEMLSDNSDFVLQPHELKPIPAHKRASRRASSR